ncbi:MAG: OmpA family protein [Spirochaetales bacterium]|nr:OmpA family protein [Spirochaetales bacterium]
MYSIGIKLYDNSIYPVGNTTSQKGAEIAITTIVDNQRIAEVEIYLIDADKVNHFKFIGKITVRNIPPAKAGEPKITLIIRSDVNNNLVAQVYSANVSYGQMKIPYETWHPDEKKPVLTVFEKPKIIEKNTSQEYDLGFSKNRLKTNTKELQKDEEEQNSSAMVIGIIAVSIVALIVILLFVFKPWESTSIAGIEDVSNFSTERPTSEPTSAPSDVPTAELTSVPDNTIANVDKTEDTSLVTNQSKIDIASINQELKSAGAILFYPESTKMLPQSENVFSRIISVLSEYKLRLNITINGHSAEYDTAAEQVQVSLDRANWLKNQLIDRGIVNAADCAVNGIGAREPITKVFEKLYLNRRVDIAVSQK